MAHLAEALRQLRASGLLLVQDPLLPCITTIVAGGPVRGSWFSGPAAHGIYNVMVALDDHPEVLVTKLVSGKVTMVHRDLWPAVLAVALSRAAWQFDNLSEAATWLLDEVQADPPIQTDLVVPPPGISRKAIPDAARELERRLLVHASEVHTPSGAHAKALKTWSAWLSESKLDTEALPSEPEARARLEEVLTRINHACGAAATLPWQPGRRPGR